MKHLLLGIETRERYLIVDVPEGADPRAMGLDAWVVQDWSRAVSDDVNDTEIRDLGEITEDIRTVPAAQNYLADQWEKKYRLLP